MSKQTRNPQETQKKILQAALEEFAQHGFHGARVDRIVQAAGVNKRMVYHYFNDKEGLFKALMESELEKIKAVEKSEPTDSCLALSEHWMDHSSETKNYFKLAMSAEALINSGDIPLDKEHEDSFTHSIEVYKKLLQDKDVDPKYFLLAMVGLSAFPIVMPKMVEFVTGSDSESEEFQQEYKKALKVLLEHL